jgi:hypothetical protein
LASLRTPPSPRASFLLALGRLAPLLAGAVFYAVFVARASFRVEGQRTFSLFDDAMISLTYARNLAEGHGLVWMPGASPVEGYTNFLWTLLMAIPHAAGLADRLTSLPVVAFGAVLLLATSALAAEIARRLARHPVTPALAAAASAFCYPLVFWTLRGLEVGLLAGLVLAACLLALRLLERPSARDRAWLCLVLAAAVLTRTDAAIFAAVVLGCLALHAGSPRRDALAGALATAATLVAHTAFRVAYYGAALPNTYHLKVGGHPLAERVARGGGALFDLVAGTLWAPLALALALLVLRRSSLGRGERLLAAIVAAAFAYSVYVGGDVWEFARFANRFVSVALPALFVLALLGSEALLALLARAVPAPAWGVLVAGLLLIGVANARPFEGWLRHGGLHVQDDEIMVRTALALRAAAPPSTRIAVVWAGAVPYFSRRPCIDLFGKSDPVIAHLAPRGPFVPGHDKWDFEYSIGRLHPEVVVLGWRIGPRDRQLLDQLGYERVEQYYVQSEADVDRRRLRAPWR